MKDDPSVITISATPDDWSLMALCAVRYALTRQSYLPAAVATSLVRLWPAVTPSDRMVVLRDIRERLADETFPLPDDVAQVWERLLSRLDVTEAPHAD